MRVVLMTAAFCAALVALPGIVMAQSEVAPDTATASKMKGPPNANGYGSDSGRSVTTGTEDKAPSASDMKGPPNANGYQKQ